VLQVWAQIRRPLMFLKTTQFTWFPPPSPAPWCPSSWSTFLAIACPFLGSPGHILWKVLLSPFRVTSILHQVSLASPERLLPQRLQGSTMGMGRQKTVKSEWIQLKRKNCSHTKCHCIPTNLAIFLAHQSYKHWRHKKEFSKLSC